MQIRNTIAGSIAGLLLLSAPAFARITTGCGDGAVGFSNGEASVVLHESGDATFINEASGPQQPVRLPLLRSSSPGQPRD
mgnify:CR=1 FL=1